ncbi:hypothetical protein BCR33DRAFT_717416 [Rhizoclosmatium globosum]|uniref:Uncharacterized protein n=1 Tax=Rhizoclosmatium globosum TaxID=329046 RepID=A0A1Y2C9Q9_9FUNG|nr:hypothetical protein BCR33DRAFT_717416 [Rhizoclosmatium globosum]|eukprot:ORY43770.1 hypothetical protein BCR33DRAFT_717416 [Rhizoclosmatium globosum]
MTATEATPLAALVEHSVAATQKVFLANFSAPIDDDATRFGLCAVSQTSFKYSQRAKLSSKIHDEWAQQSKAPTKDNLCRRSKVERSVSY